MTLSLIVTFYDGDCHLISPFLENLQLSGFSGVDQLIIVSTGTRHVCSDVKAEDFGIPDQCKLLVIESSVRRSQATARNFGISSATSEIISFHDGDDIPHSSKFNILKRIFLDLPPLDWLCHDTLEDLSLLRSKVFNGLQPPLCISPPSVSRYGEAPSFNNGKSASGASALTVRRRVLERLRYSEKAHDYRHEDTEFIWRVFAAGYVGAFLEWPLSTYRPSGTERLIKDMVALSRFIDGDPVSLREYLRKRGVEVDC